jgi:hypothetical protein
MRKSLALIAFGAALLGLVAAAGCGEETKPHPGYADPCDTPMSSVLDCPSVSVPAEPEMTTEAACRKLVTCGILAQSYLEPGGGAGCGDATLCKDRPGGKCLVDDKGETRCYYPDLDYYWCTARLTVARRSDPCDPSGQTPFTYQQVEAAVRCIQETQCGTLGLGFSDKQIGDATKRPELDKYACKDGKTTVWAATICDLGLLAY